MQAKPFVISKREVWEAYKEVKANQGAAGVDGQTIEAFERDLSHNLYRIWNRMCSGSYFPAPIRRVDIPKAGQPGKTRPLGIPTVTDRVAQTVAKRYLESRLDGLFHPDSYAYRPGKSALDAVARARERCWRYDWVLDLDIKSFFDTIDWELLMRAVRKHVDSAWVLLYLERWLRAPVQLPDDRVETRERGTPQGAVVSPILANLFLHYVFDRWMARHYPDITFERYADDAILHCRSLAEATELRATLEARFAQCKLQLNAQKTKIVYCKDRQRAGDYTVRSFDFLGYTFRPRLSQGPRERFCNFTPAVSNKAARAMRATIRSWRLHRRSDKRLTDLAYMFNPVVSGWINYYGRFRKSALVRALFTLDRYLIRWLLAKYKSLRGHRRRAWDVLVRIEHQQPSLFAHWRLAGKGLSATRAV